MEDFHGFSKLPAMFDTQRVPHSWVSLAKELQQLDEVDPERQRAQARSAGVVPGTSQD